MEFKVSFDTYAKTVIGFVTILFLAIIGFFVVKIIQSKNPDRLIIPFGLATIINVLIYTICYLYQPQKYVIESGKLIIKRPLKDKLIELSAIKKVYPIEKGSMGWITKTFGNGGLFGFYGEFRSDRHGDMTWYATRKSNYVMLETSEGKIVLTPDNLEMANEIKKLIRQ